MKKVLLLHMDTTLNYGSAMMGINTINYIVENSNRKDLNFTIDSERDIDVERLKESTGYNQINRFDYKPIEVTGNKCSKIFKFILNFFRFRKYCKNFDIVCVIGGDDISEYYSKLNPFIYLFRAYLVSRIRPVFIFGQTLGPFSGINKRIVKYFLPKLKVYSRDFASVDNLTNTLNIDSVVESRDLAFIDLPFQDMGYEFKGYPNDSFIAIVISGLDLHYAHNRENYIESWIKITKTILKKYPTKNVLLLGHVYKEKIDACDIYFSRIIKEKIPEERLNILDKIMLPHEMRNILGQAYFTLTGRMHAAVSTFSMYKPAISLSYSLKYDGVIGQGLNLPNLVVKSTKNDWANGQISNKINDTMDHLEENRTEIISMIKNKVCESSELAKMPLKDIVNSL